MHVQLCIRKIFFCLVTAPTQRSDSKAIHKFSKFITGISFYYIQQVINPYRQRGYIINTKVFITQQITSNEMNFNSTNHRRWKRLLWTIVKPLGRAIYCQSRDQRRTDHWCPLHNLLLVYVVGPPSEEVYMTVANFPQVDDLRSINPWEA